MSIATVADFARVLRSLPLLEAGQSEELTTLLPGAGDPRQLARTLIDRQWLTPYQVNQVLQGKGQQLVLGAYVLLERLGQGGMGAVYKARHQRMGLVVALKVILPDRVHNEALVRRFQREIRAACRLDHPNVVRGFDADEVNGNLLFAMEFVQGTDLAKYVKKNSRLSAAQACDFTRQAALGLQHAFEKGLVHRDIKPSNLFLVEATSTVKVLDLGLARFESSADPDDRTSTLTQEGAVMGTPDYIAPEQALSAHDADIRADVYSLGCTLYFLLAARTPFAGGSLAQKIAWHMSAIAPAIEDLAPGLPRGLGGVIRKMMAKHPSQRHQTPAEVADALAPFVKAEESVTIPVAVAVPVAVSETVRPAATAVTPLAPRRRPRKRWPIAAAAAGGLMLLLLVVLLTRGGKKDGPPNTGPTAPPAGGGGTPPVQTPLTGDWQALFNGRDLDGWFGSDEVWKVENGEIVGRNRGAGVSQYLYSRATAGDFDLRLKVKLVNEEGNSGVFFRSTVADGKVNGYQADIGTNWWGILYEENGRGMLTRKDAQAHVRPGDWNEYEVRARGSHIVILLNGQPCVDLDDPQGPRDGGIALQVHGGSAMEVRFKDIQWRSDASAGAEGRPPLFNGTDLAGWRAHHPGVARFRNLFIKLLS